MKLVINQFYNNCYEILYITEEHLFSKFCKGWIDSYNNFNNINDLINLENSSLEDNLKYALFEYITQLKVIDVDDEDIDIKQDFFILPKKENKEYKAINADDFLKTFNNYIFNELNIGEFLKIKDFITIQPKEASYLTAINLLNKLSSLDNVYKESYFILGLENEHYM